MSREIREGPKISPRIVKNQSGPSRTKPHTDNHAQERAASMNSDETHFHHLFNQRCVLGSGRPRLSIDRHPHLYRCVPIWPEQGSYEEFTPTQSFPYELQAVSGCLSVWARWTTAAVDPRGDLAAPIRRSYSWR